MASVTSQRFVGFVLAGLLVATTATAQTSSTPVPMPNAMAMKPGAKRVDGQTVYRYVEKMPLYLDGGQEGLQAAITKHVRSGAASGSRSYISFVVDQRGTIRNPAFGGSSAEGVASVEPLLAEAVANMGKFRPGYQNGKPVNVELTMPLVKRAKN